jgi:hypothetical protein
MTKDPDFETLRQDLRALHDSFIDAHVRNRPEVLIEDLDEDYVNVSRGDLVRATKEQILEQLTQYLASTEFSEYSMLEEPRIDFSDDGTVAWSMYRLRVAATWHGPEGNDVKYEDTWACLTLFRRHGTQWRRIAEASNRSPRSGNGSEDSDPS